MSYKRTFDTGRLDSPRFKRLAAGARLVYMTLWFNKAAHLSGLYAIGVDEIALFTAQDVESVKNHLLALSEHPALVVYAPVACVVWVVDMLEDQGRGSKVATCVKAQIAQLAKNCGLPRALLADFLARYGPVLALDGEWSRLRLEDCTPDTPSIPHRYPIDTPSKGYPSSLSAVDSGLASDSALGLGLASELQLQSPREGMSEGTAEGVSDAQAPLPLPHQPPPLAQALQLIADASSGRFVVSHRPRAGERRNAVLEQDTLGLPQLLWGRLRQALSELAPTAEQLVQLGGWIGAGGWAHLQPAVTPDYLVGHWHEGLTQAAAWDGKALSRRGQAQGVANVDADTQKAYRGAF